MIRKRYYNVLMCLCVGMMLSACAKNTEHYGVEAKTVYFATLEEMDEYATVIVKATRLKGEKAVLTKNTANGSDYYVSAGVNYGTVSLGEDGRTTQRKDTRGNAVSEFSAYTEIWEAAKEKYIE